MTIESLALSEVHHYEELVRDMAVTLRRSGFDRDTANLYASHLVNAFEDIRMDEYMREHLRIAPSKDKKTRLHELELAGVVISGDVFDKLNTSYKTMLEKYI